MDDLFFTVQAVGPVFIIIFLGLLMRSRGWVDEGFLRVSSRLVFNVSLPALIFLELSTLDLTQAIDGAVIGYVYAGTVCSFVLSWLVAVRYVPEPRDRSAFIQGSFRGNYAIIGLAMIASIYGPESLGGASVLLAFILPLYNILAVVALTVPMKSERVGVRRVLKEIVLNPLIVAVLVALPVAFLQVPVPALVLKTGGYLAALTLPLALLAIGGSLAAGYEKATTQLAAGAAMLKIVVTPGLLTAAAVWAGFSGPALLTMFILFASPTAVVSFVMAEAMGANSRLAGHIIAVSTAASSLTMAVGLFILKSLQLL